MRNREIQLPCSPGQVRLCDGELRRVTASCTDACLPGRCISSNLPEAYSRRSIGRADGDCDDCCIIDNADDRLKHVAVRLSHIPPREPHEAQCIRHSEYFPFSVESNWNERKRIRKSGTFERTPNSSATQVNVMNDNGQKFGRDSGTRTSLSYLTTLSFSTSFQLRAVNSKQTPWPRPFPEASHLLRLTQRPGPSYADTVTSVLNLAVSSRQALRVLEGFGYRIRLGWSTFQRATHVVSPCCKPSVGCAPQLSSRSSWLSRGLQSAR